MSGSWSRAQWLRRWAPGGACVIAAAVAIQAPMAMAAPTPPSRRDVRSARRFIAILNGFYETALRTRREARADVNALLKHVKAQCPMITLPSGGRRQDRVLSHLFTEAADNLGLAISGPLDDAAAQEAGALAHLHFSSRRLNRDVRQMARSQRLTAELTPSDLCGDIRAAAGADYRRQSRATTRFLAVVHRALSAPAPSLAELEKDPRPYLTAPHDRAALRRLRTLVTRYAGFALTLGINAEFKLSGLLTHVPGPIGDQAVTTTAASTRSTSSSNEIPAASAARGRRLVSVSPGMGLTSSTNSSLVELSSIRSTRAKPAHPSRPYVSSAIASARVATVSSIRAGQTKRVRPIS